MASRRRALKAQLKAQLAALDTERAEQLEAKLRVALAGHERALDVVPAYVAWYETRKTLTDDFYCQPTSGSSGYWSVDESYSDICKTWEDARDQMGTTRRKFELEGMDLPSALDIGRLFDGAGIPALVCTYSSWRLGYDYVVRGIMDEETEDRNEPNHGTHVCLGKPRATFWEEGKDAE